MAELIPYPFAALIERMFSELESADSIFDLPSKSFFLGREVRDYSVPFHDKRAPTPLGPASGPQTQMAQNLVLSWLCGCRILELKTFRFLMSWKFHDHASTWKPSDTTSNGPRN